MHATQGPNGADLVRDPPVVLKNVVVLEPRRNGNLLGYRQRVDEVIIGDVVKLLAVGCGRYEDPEW